jgi:hypothetical protein
MTQEEACRRAITLLHGIGLRSDDSDSYGRARSEAEDILLDLLRELECSEVAAAYERLSTRLWPPQTIV